MGGIRAKVACRNENRQHLRSVSEVWGLTWVQLGDEEEEKIKEHSNFLRMEGIVVLPISKKKETWENKLITNIRRNGFSLSVGLNTRPKSIKMRPEAKVCNYNTK